MRGKRPAEITAVFPFPAGPAAPSSRRSRHLPVAVVDGSLTENLNEIGVRLWTDRSLVATLVEPCVSQWICQRITPALAGGGAPEGSPSWSLDVYAVWCDTAPGIPDGSSANTGS